MTDPVCGQTVDPLRARAVAIYAGKRYYFWSAAHRVQFTAAPEKNVAMDSPLTPVPTPTPPERRDREAGPESKGQRWWFWAAVGAVALTATGVTLGLVLGGDEEGRLPPLACGPVGCDPADAARTR